MMTIDNSTFVNHQPVKTNKVFDIPVKIRTQLVKFGSYIQKYLKSRQQLRINRAAFDNLLSLDDTVLKDIGVLRDDVIWASNLPLSKNAALELSRISSCQAF